MSHYQRLSKIKNKAPAQIQITAEQILSEANERREPGLVVPKQAIIDKEELDEYCERKRMEFENKIRANRHAISTWCQYAHWEASQNELERARSIYERALDIQYTNQLVWLRYVEMEMSRKNINRARNLYDRVVSHMPRVDTFWYKYVYMEELLGNIRGARQIFERWIKWDPPEEVWIAYVKFEQRYKETKLARNVFKRFVETHPNTKNWIKWAKFELSIGRPDLARSIYELCIKTQDDEFLDQNFYISFAKFESRQKELERADAIYKYALKNLPKDQVNNIRNEYYLFQKQYCDDDKIDESIIMKRRALYEKETKENPKNYDNWLDYIRLEESTTNNDAIRQVYELAIAEVVPVEEKHLWSRYIYIWLFYAIWEESNNNECEKAREIYKRCLNLIPHKKFTFAKVWLNYANFLVRRKEISTARRVLFTAVNVTPKGKLFKGFINLELQLREFDRVRKLYEKYIEWNPVNSLAWLNYAELEHMIGDSERCKGILEAAIDLPEMDMPETIWKFYIDMEIEEEEWDKARALYERLISKTDHVKVWTSYANFEYGVRYDDSDDKTKNIKQVRNVFDRACKYFLSRGDDGRKERLLILEAWKQFEKTNGDEAHLKSVEAKFPRIVKKRRELVDNTTGKSMGWEEYDEYVFPEGKNEESNLKLLSMAHEWKRRLAQNPNENNIGVNNKENETNGFSDSEDKKGS